MRCPNHPEMEADFTCAQCGREVCAKCIEDRGGQWICADCLAKMQQPPASAAQPPQQPSQGPPEPVPPPQPPPLQTPPPPPAYPPTPGIVGPSAVSIISLVCGIVGLLMCCDPFGVRLLFNIAALVLGLIALYSKAPEAVHGASRPYAIAGIVTGGLGILLFLLAVAGLFALSGILGEFGRRFEPMLR